ncbi:MAG: hypothetical protein WD894_14790 [Pirellulales bacterium]
MNRVVIEDSMREACEKAEGPVEVCDREGRFLGFFISAGDRAIYRLLDSGLSEEALQARLREKGGRPLEDILRDLEAQA